MWIQFHLIVDFYLVFCDKSPQSINYMRWATVGHCRFKRGHRDWISSLVKRVFKKRISTVWHTTFFSWKGYFGRRRDKNTGLIENTDESCCPLFQTDEKTRERRKNPHEFMHQSCHTSGHGTLIGGRFVPCGTPRLLSMKERWWLAAVIKCSCHSGASWEDPINNLRWNQVIPVATKVFLNRYRSKSTSTGSGFVLIDSILCWRGASAVFICREKNCHFIICCTVKEKKKQKNTIH